MLKCRYPPCESDADPQHNGYCSNDHKWLHSREHSTPREPEPPERHRPPGIRARDRPAPRAFDEY